MADRCNHTWFIGLRQGLAGRLTRRCVLLDQSVLCVDQGQLLCVRKDASLLLPSAAGGPRAPLQRPARAAPPLHALFVSLGGAAKHGNTTPAHTKGSGPSMLCAHAHTATWRVGLPTARIQVSKKTQA
jgi:hypothetical protein